MNVGVAINRSSNAIFVMITIMILVPRNAQTDNKGHYGVAKHVIMIKRTKRTIKIIIWPVTPRMINVKNVTEEEFNSKLL